jgi:hypothetical protein
LFECICGENELKVEICSNNFYTLILISNKTVKQTYLKLGILYSYKLVVHKFLLWDNCTNLPICHFEFEIPTVSLFLQIPTHPLEFVAKTTQLV